MNLKLKQVGLLALSLLTIATFQNCAPVNIQFADTTTESSLGGGGDGNLEVCNGVSCELDPLTSKPAVTTILLALGDEADNQLVVKGASAQLIAETVVRYSTPVNNPKILIVNDYAAGSEDPEDTIYVKEVLLGRYNVSMISDSSSGLNDSDLAGYDLVWFNNPGAPMGSERTAAALKKFKGGVVIQGDDLARGVGDFSIEALTGLKYLDNGVSVKCEGVYYKHDNNTGYKYQVKLNDAKIPGTSSTTVDFEYGNDIDNTIPARADLEILATAVGGHSSCSEERPTIVRYLK